MLKALHKDVYRNRLRRSLSERLFDYGNVIFMVILAVVMIYPFWYVLIIAFNNGEDARFGGIYLWPRDFTLDNFNYILRYPGLWQAAYITVMRCILGASLNVFICLLTAYALSKRYLKGRKFIIFFLLIPMFFGGTIIARYIVMAQLGLINNFLVYIIPGAFSYFTAIILRSFMDGLPYELQESAMIDGAGHFRIFGQIVVPLLKPAIAAWMFFGIVAHWLDVTTTVFFVSSERSLWVLQYIMHRVVASAEATVIINTNDPLTAAMQMMYLSQNRGSFRPPTEQVIKMAIIAVVTFPMLVIYPFFQKFFVKGTITGAIKA